MRFTRAERAGIDVSQIAVGTWGIGGKGFGAIDDEQSIRAIHKMIEYGVNLIDTAPVYGDGHSEEVVGRALKGLDRSKVLVSTKFGLVLGGKFERNSSYDATIKGCEDSLRRLGTDYIDIFIQHWPDPNTPIEEGMRALEDLKKAGKVRFAAVSNFDRAMIEEADKTVRIDFLQPPYSMIDESEKELLKFCEEKGIGTMTYGSLGAGLLSGKIREMPKYEEGHVRNGFYAAYYSEENFAKLQSLLKVMDKIAEAHDKPVSHVALNWSTQKSYVTTALCGVRTEAHAAENCAAFDWMLTAEEMAVLDATLEELGLSGVVASSGGKKYEKK